METKSSAVSFSTTGFIELRPAALPCAGLHVVHLPHFLKSIIVLMKYSTGYPATGAFSGRPLPFGMWHRLQAATGCACFPLATNLKHLRVIA